MKKQNKYNAQLTRLGEHNFNSKREATRYGELLILQRAGEITDLKCHPRYDMVVNHQKVCAYIADFSYKTPVGELVVEDVKSKPTITPQYRIKKKLLKALHGIDIKEVF